MLNIMTSPDSTALTSLSLASALNSGVRKNCANLHQIVKCSVKTNKPNILI